MQQQLRELGERVAGVYDFFFGSHPQGETRCRLTRQCVCADRLGTRIMVAFERESAGCRTATVVASKPATPVTAAQSDDVA